VRTEDEIGREEEEETSEQRRSELHVHLELVVRLVLNLVHFTQRLVHQWNHVTFPGRGFDFDASIGFHDAIDEVHVLWWSLRQRRISEVKHETAIIHDPGAAGGSGEPSSPGRGRVIGRNLTLIAQHHSPRRN